MHQDNNETTANQGEVQDSEVIVISSESDEDVRTSAPSENEAKPFHRFKYNLVRKDPIFRPDGENGSAIPNNIPQHENIATYNLRSDSSAPKEDQKAHVPAPLVDNQCEHAIQEGAGLIGSNVIQSLRGAAKRPIQRQEFTLSTSNLKCSRIDTNFLDENTQNASHATIWNLFAGISKLNRIENGQKSPKEITSNIGMEEHKTNKNWTLNNEEDSPNTSLFSGSQEQETEMNTLPKEDIDPLRSPALRTKAVNSAMKLRYELDYLDIWNQPELIEQPLCAQTAAPKLKDDKKNEDQWIAEQITTQYPSTSGCSESSGSESSWIITKIATEELKTNESPTMNPSEEVHLTSTINFAGFLKKHEMFVENKLQSEEVGNHFAPAMNVSHEVQPSNFPKSEEIVKSQTEKKSPTTNSFNTLTTTDDCLEMNASNPVHPFITSLGECEHENENNSNHSSFSSTRSIFSVNEDKASKENVEESIGPDIFAQTIVQNSTEVPTPYSTAMVFNAKSSIKQNGGENNSSQKENHPFSNANETEVDLKKENQSDASPLSEPSSPFLMPVKQIEQSFSPAINLLEDIVRYGFIDLTKDKSKCEDDQSSTSSMSSTSFVTVKSLDHNDEVPSTTEMNASTCDMLTFTQSSNEILIKVTGESSVIIDPSQSSVKFPLRMTKPNEKEGNSIVSSNLDVQEVESFQAITTPAIIRQEEQENETLHLHYDFDTTDLSARLYGSDFSSV